LASIPYNILHQPKPRQSKMSVYNRGPAPRRSGSVKPKASVPLFTTVPLLRTERNFEFTTIEKILIEICKELGGIALCGGWVRDKLLGLKPKDYDLIISYPDYDKFKLKFTSLFKTNAELKGYSWEDLSTPPVVRKPGRSKKPLRCGYDFICYKFRLTSTETGESTDVEVDAKQLYPGQEFSSDITRRDFTVNCLLYSIRNDFIAHRKGDYEDLVSKVLNNAVNFSETMSDPVRFLRAFRLKHEKGLNFGKELRIQLKTDHGAKFSGYHFKTPSQHGRKASPLEYKKIISNPKVVHSCIAEIYEYGYIFRWKSGGSESEVATKANLLSRGLSTCFQDTWSNIQKWAVWNKEAESGYLSQAFLVALAIYDLDRAPEEALGLRFVCQTVFYQLLTAFVPEDQRSKLTEFLEQLAEDYDKGVPELKRLYTFRRAFRPDFPDIPSKQNVSSSKPDVRDKKASGEPQAKSVDIVTVEDKLRVSPSKGYRVQVYDEDEDIFVDTEHDDYEELF
jgi:Poly A polymerase head domain